MSDLMDEQTKKELREALKDLGADVKVVFFGRNKDCPGCASQHEILKVVAKTSKRITLEVLDLEANAKEALEYGVDKVPATLVIGSRGRALKYYGVSAGYEFSSLIDSVRLAASGKTGLPPELETLVARIDAPVRLQVFVTLACPYCPKMVHTANEMALANPNVTAETVEAGEFPELARKYDVSGVPRTVINETRFMEGALPPMAALMEVLKAVSPGEYEKLLETVRESNPDRRVRRPEPGNVYEILIVGGGPAALSAAVYAARKDLDVLLLARDFGGQITNTATVENYLGLHGIGGQDMAELFRSHMERYPVAEAAGSKVVALARENDVFVARTEDGVTYKARAAVFCAGKEYKRLQIPGEDAFIGKGIAFCATCDAPLYRGRKVAVVGGGSSAFTAVRDLLNFASEVHLVHRRAEFTAEARLRNEILSAPSLVVHTPFAATAFLGKEKLAGVRIESADGAQRLDLPVDGVFLEIGLTPNSDPVKDLVALNEHGEVPVGRDMETTVEGLFAAGDVTDVREKQIAVAVGDGATAALAAHRYLLEKGLTRSRVRPEDAWQ
ncbi:MAG: FAD-dependent oxidoreductase [Deltaproteobacteria bacterium]|nr:FAD-dependent oxidoreductase [Deltaproteobacteria bacterium]